MSNEFHKGITTLGNLFSIDVKPLCSLWTTIYKHRCKHRGKVDAVKFMKQLNVVAERYALYQQVEHIPWTKSDNNGFPKIINKFKPYLRSENTMTVVMALSVMRSVEVLRLPISKDISTVLAPCSANMHVVNDIIDFIPQWIKTIPSLELGRMKYHISVRNGPNGHALRESDLDILALMSSPKLLEAIRTVERLTNDKFPMIEIEREISQNPIHSKLTQFPEKAGKTRTIAIIDYYSQRCLRPLHKGLMSLLGKLVSDGTYSHIYVGNYAKQKTKEKSFIACADLSAATDRFPAEIQRVLLFELLKDPDLSAALWTLLAERTFTVAWSGEIVTYNCGQPMGAYSSWPLFALAHHLLVEYCAFKSGVRDVKSKYRLIGDDVIISDETVWTVYLKVVQDLGLEVNLGKTVISPSNGTYSGAEVAKQLYLNGRCLTPLTPGFVRNLRKVYMLNTCLQTIKDRYDDISILTYLPCIVDAFYRNSRKRKQAWLLISNPITGVVKPGNPGYDDNSVWDPTLVDRAMSEYVTILTNRFYDIATEVSERCKPYIRLRPGGPWKDPTRPPPRALISSLRSLLVDLQNKTEKSMMAFLSPDPSKLLEELTFVPNPETPYMEPHELAQKRLSSTIVTLYRKLTH